MSLSLRGLVFFSASLLFLATPYAAVSAHSFCEETAVNVTQNGNFAAVEKADLLVDTLEVFLGRKLNLKAPEKFIPQIIQQAHLRNGPLQAEEAERGLKILIRYFDLTEKDSRNFLQRWLWRGLEQEARQKIESSLLRDPKLTQRLEAFTEKPLFYPVPRNLEIAGAIARNTGAAASSLVVNAALIFLGFPPLNLPNFKTLPFATPDTAVIDIAKQESLGMASRIAFSHMGLWGKIHQHYRTAYKLYFAALLTAGLTYSALHPEILMAPLNYWRSGYVLHHTSKGQLKNYEQNTYSAKQVIEEQLQSWLEAQDETPSPEQIEKMRNELEAQEKTGVLRVFDSEKTFSH